MTRLLLAGSSDIGPQAICRFTFPKTKMEPEPEQRPVPSVFFFWGSLQVLLQFSEGVLGARSAALKPFQDSKFGRQVLLGIQAWLSFSV